LGAKAKARSCSLLSNLTLRPSPLSHRRSPWSPRSIAWRAVLASAPWATSVTIAALTIIPLAVLEFGHVPPRARPHDVYDATIARPLRPNTVPSAAAIFVPLLLALASAVFGEACLRRAVNGCATAAAAGVLYTACDAVSALLTTGLLTEATKLGVGWLRPYFLAACAPAVDAAAAGIALNIGGAGGGAPPCTAPAAAQRPARLSFPSGHTSTSTVSAAFAATYLLWAAATGLRRVRGGGPAAPAPAASPRARDFVLSLALLASLAQLSLAWGIGATRLNDFRHHPADVVGGFVLGGVVGGMFAVRSIVGRGLAGVGGSVGDKGGGGEGEDGAAAV
jgi:membrane-associated phospholipid phosphatase